MTNIVQHLATPTPGYVPPLAILAPRQMAINLSDQLIYIRDMSGNVVNLGGAGMPIAITGDISGTGSPVTGIALTLPAIVTGGTYTKLTISAKGLVTSATQLLNSDVTTALGYTPANKAGDTITGSFTFSGGATVTGLPNPVNTSDAANKAYVDAVAAGLEPRDACQAASTTALTATYANGTAGVGATLTNAGTQTALVLDGYTPNLNERVLIKNQISLVQDGIYTVTNQGSASTNWVLTRASDFDNSVPGNARPGAFVFIQNGTTQQSTGWTEILDGSGTGGVIVIGTDNIKFSQTSGAGTYLAGTGLTLTGNTFSITNTTTAGTYGSVTVNAQGQVTSAAVVSAVANGGTGVATLTGLAKGNGTGAFSAAVAGTDYSVGTSALGTGILKSTTSTGALTIAVASDFPTLNQSTTGNAATATAISGGAANLIPYQTATSITNFSNNLAFYATTGDMVIGGGTDNATDKLQVGGSIYASGVLKTNGSTLTLGGAFTTSGAFALTLTTTAATSVTLPTSGTLATTANIATALPSISNTTLYGGTGAAGGAAGVSLGSGLAIASNTLSNTGVLSLAGTTNQVSVSASTGAITISLPQSIATTSSPTFASVTSGTLVLTGSSTGTTTISSANAGTTNFALVVPAVNGNFVTTGDTGTVTSAMMSATGVAGNYTAANITVDAAGRITAASSGSGGGGGTVTAVSVATANGFAGTSSGGATPALTLTTPVSGILYGNGTAMQAVTVGTGLSFLSGTLSATGGSSSWSSLTAPTVSNSATATVDTTQTLLGHFDTSATTHQALFVLSEDVASTKSTAVGSYSSLLQITTLASSTTSPIAISCLGQSLSTPVFRISNIGQVTIAPCSASLTGGSGAGFSVTTGAGSASSASGAIFFITGNGAGAGTSNIAITTGSDTVGGTSGNVALTTGVGNSSSGTSGSITSTVGTAYTGGNITFTSGPGQGGGAGSVSITASNDSGAGAGGSINLQAGTTNSGTVNGTINLLSRTVLSSSSVPITTASATGAFSYGTLTYTDTNLFASYQASVNSYAQMILQNTSNGATASTDIVISNNNGTATTYYGNFGMNSSGFTGSGSYNIANAVYLSSTSGDLAIGSTTSNSVHIFVNSQANDSITVAGSTGNITLAGLTDTANGTTNGSNISIIGGAVAGTASTSGTIMLQSGAATSTSGTSLTGSVTIGSGNSSSTAGSSSGTVTLSSGSVAGTSASGNVTVTSGASSSSGYTGSLSLNTGNSSTGIAGAIQIALGTSNANTTPGVLSLTGSNNSATGAAQGGGITITGGSSAGTQGAGNVTITGGANTQATATTGSGGIINIIGGASTNGQGGSINITSGTSNNAGPDSSGYVTITSGNQGSAGSNSGQVTVTTGTVASSTVAGSNSGNLVLSTGQVTSTLAAASSGTITIQPGTSRTATPGALYLYGGSGGVGSSSGGGAVSILGGSSVTTAGAGNVTVTGGQNTNTGPAGTVTITTSANSTGTTGATTVSTGAGTSQSSGIVTIQSGAVTGSGFHTGNVTIDVGAATSSATAGSVYIGNTNASSVNIAGNTNNNVNIGGSFNNNTAAFTCYVGTGGFYVQSSPASSAITGAVTLATGNATGFSSGPVDLSTGSATGSGNQSGNIVIDVGNATGSATHGTIIIGTTNASQVTIGTTTNTTSGIILKTAPSSTSSAPVTINGGNVPYVFAQSGISFVIPSSGTMGNNGALSAITALQTTFSGGCYMYFPSGAISSGSAAGWYWTVMSSTTAGTVYNSTYTSGIPATGTTTAFSTTGPGAYTQVTTAISGPTISVPAYAMGPNGRIEFETVAANNNTSNNKTFGFTFGGTSFWQYVPTTTTGAAFRFGVANKNSLSINVGFPAVSASGFGSVAASLIYGTIATASAQNAILTMQLATATDTMVLDNFVMKLIPG